MVLLTVAVNTMRSRSHERGIQPNSIHYRIEPCPLSAAIQNYTMIFPKVPCRSKIESKSVYYSFSPLFSYSRCFGLSPFSIETNVFGEFQRVKLTCFDVVWFCISIFIHVCLIIKLTTSLINDISRLKGLHVFLLGFDHFLLSYAAIVCITYIVLNLINRNRILDNIHRFDAFDKEVIFLKYCIYYINTSSSQKLLLKFVKFQMRCYGVSINYNRMRRRLIFWMVLHVVGITAVSAFTKCWHRSFKVFQFKWDQSILYILVYLCDYCLALVVTEFVYFIMNVNLRFDVLNKSMK